MPHGPIGIQEFWKQGWSQGFPKGWCIETGQYYTKMSIGGSAGLLSQKITFYNVIRKGSSMF